MRRPRTMVGRLFVWQISLVLILLLALGVVLDRVLEREAVDSLTGQLVSQARTIREALPSVTDGLQEDAVRLGVAGAVRITVIRTDGVVLADSEHDPATMENHLTRPEVQEALRGVVGTDSRRSATLGVEFRYVALPSENGRIVRLAVPLTRVRQLQRTVRIALIAGLLAAAAVAVGGVLVVSRGVAGPLRRMAESVASMGGDDLTARVEPGETSELAALADAVNRMASRIEEQVREARDAQRIRDLVLSSMEEGVLLAGPDGRVSFANAAVGGLLGYAPETTSRIPPALWDAMDRAAAARAPTSVEVETGSPPRWLRGAAVPVSGDGSVLLVVRDVTQARRLEAVRRDFVTNASHELKTPAASIQAAAETIRDAAVENPGVLPEFTDRLEREAVRLSRIVSDLLDLSRLETGAVMEEPVPLDAVVRDEAARFAESAAGSGVDLTVEADGPLTVRGSGRDLRLLVRNLIDNAVRYTQDGGSVRVRLDSEDGEAVLRVDDTGIGIPSRDIPRVFERFYRVDRARSRETGGTGLGLSIVRHIAENHGGSVAVTSELGRGSAFEVRLPLSG